MGTHKNTKSANRAIVDVSSFIQATRDSGYKTTASALSELIDNAIEAEASHINIQVEEDPLGCKNENGIAISVHDDGRGMTRETLRVALQFGGSTRFNSRRGLGRYGMGLPNGSLSQARRVEVLTWQRPDEIWSCYLDLDETTKQDLKYMPKPTRTPRNTFIPPTRSGTVVRLLKCDRLDYKTLSRLENQLHSELGRIFRTFLFAKRTIVINGCPVIPNDPLFLKVGINPSGARPYGPPIEYKLRVPASGIVARILVIFSELPIERWHGLSNDDKNRLGISKGAGVSVLRAGREIDHGWYFMGTKRRENYDDWWRCEVHFEPELDEYFGVTHTKQRINPTHALNSILVSEMERIARELNVHVRRNYFTIRGTLGAATELRSIEHRDHLLEPPKSFVHQRSQLQDYSTLRKRTVGIRGMQFKIALEATDEDCFYTPVLAKDCITIVLNSNHPFLKKGLISPKHGDSSVKEMHALLAAAARTEVCLRDKKSRDILRKFRNSWGRTLSVYAS